MKKFFYRVAENDTLLSLSHKFLIAPVKIIKLNNLDSEIEEGDLLYLESDSENLYTVKLGDSLESIAEKFNVPPQKILSDNGVDYIFYSLILSI